MTIIIAGVVFIIAVTGCAIMMKNIKAKKKVPGDRPASTKPSVSDPSSGTASDLEYKTILDNLLNLNIMMRKDIGLSIEIIRQIETIIDDLMIVIPSMMERYPGETLTYEIKKIGRKHLFKTVKEYLDLSQTSREHQFNLFTKTIESLQEVSNRSRDIVEKNETAEFKTMASFLAGKFS